VFWGEKGFIRLYKFFYIGCHFGKGFFMVVKQHILLNGVMGGDEWFCG